MTPAYCSPEQARGEKLSHKTDLWSWGLSVLEMFTGEVTWLSGTAAAEILEGYLETEAEHKDIPPMPPELAALLRQCFRQNPAERPRDMREVSGRLQAIYARETGTPYPRKEPEAVKLRASALNNKALSLLDLGQPEQAQAAWEEALKLEAHHLEVIYNSGLIQWRSARLMDDALLEKLREAGNSHPGDWKLAYLQALVHLERGDGMSASVALKSLHGRDAERQEVMAASKLADSPNANPYRLARTFEGHERSVSSVCLSTDGRYALSGSWDNTLKLWEVATGLCLRTFEGHKRYVSSVCLSTDGYYAISGGWGDELKLWDVSSGLCLRHFVGHDGGVGSVCLSADGRYALSGGYDYYHYTLKLWEVETGHCLRTFEGHKLHVTSVSLSTDGRYALSGSRDMMLKLWEVETGYCLHTFKGHNQQVTSVSLSADGRYALSGSGDHTLKLWEVASGRCLRTITGHTEAVTSVRLRADGSYALSVSDDKTLKLWDVRSGRCLRTLEGNMDHLGTVSLSADERCAVSVSRDRIFRLWELDWAVVPHTAPFKLSQVQQTHEALTSQQAFENLLAQAYQLLMQGKAVDAARKVRQARTQPEFSVDPRALQLWQQLYMRLPRTAFRQGWKLHELLGHQKGIFSICLNANGHYALSGSGDLKLKLWDVRSGRCLRTFAEETICVRSVCMSADGHYALSGGDNKLKLWDVASGRCLRTFEGHKFGVSSVYLNADGHYALSGSGDMTLKLWEVASGRCLRTFQGHNHHVTSVCLSTNGLYALSSSFNTTLKLWDLASGRCLRTFEGHTSNVNSVSLSADGRYALSGSMDRTIKLWALDWELEDKEPADWDKGAQPHLENFLTLHTPYAGKLPQDRQPTEEEITLALTRRGVPTWTEEDFKGLLYTLGCAGYGWLRPEGIRSKLEQMREERR